MIPGIRLLPLLTDSSHRPREHVNVRSELIDCLYGCESFRLLSVVDYDPNRHLSADECDADGVTPGEFRYAASGLTCEVYGKLAEILIHDASLLVEHSHRDTDRDDSED